MNERRLARIEQQIKERVATALLHEIADPRVGFVTISRVEVDKELQRCIVYWSVLGGENAERLTATALGNAAGFLRREVAAALHTRTVPMLEFRHDASISGAVEMQNLLDGLRQEREDREAEQEPDGDSPGEGEDAAPRDGSSPQSDT